MSKSVNLIAGKPGSYVKPELVTHLLDIEDRLNSVLETTEVREAMNKQFSDLMLYGKADNVNLAITLEKLLSKGGDQNV